MATARAQAHNNREDDDDDDEQEHVDYSFTPDDDRFEMTEDINDDAADTTARPNPAARYVVDRTHEEAPDAEHDTPSDRSMLTQLHRQSLGPIEEMEVDLFDKVERAVPSGSRTTKQVFVCKFCAEEFPYMTRDLHTHKTVCPKFPGRQGMTREVQSVPDEEDPEIAVDVEVVGEEMPAGEDAEEDIQGPDAPVVDEDVEEEGGKGGEEGDDQGVDMGKKEEGEEQEDTEMTQMTEEEPLAVVVPDRVEMPGEVDAPRPTLKVVKLKTATDGSGDVEMEDESEAEESTKPPDARTGDEAAVARSTSPGNASETASTSSAYNGRDTSYRSSFRMFADAEGEHAECLQCGKVCSNRGSAMATHYRKCTTAHQATATTATTQDRPSTLQQSITPKKKSTKRRIAGPELDAALEDEATSQANDSDVDSFPGSPPLRRSKRFRSDSKGDQHTVSKPATETEPLDLTEASTPATVETAAAASKHKSTENLGEFEEPSLLEFEVAARGTRIKCKHCGVETAFRKDTAEKHLGECDAYRTHVGGGNARTGKDAERTTTPALARAQKRAKTTDRSTAAASAMSRHPERLQTTDIVEFDPDTAVSWIFGSHATVELMRAHYGDKPMAVRSPAARFRPVEVALCNLNVSTLLAQVPASATITVVVPGSARGDSNDDGIVSCTSTAALTLHGAGALLVFPAPAMVARMFVPHLAREVKCSALVPTEMHKSELFCGRAGLQLGWQYHKADTFVVCLRGKTLWRLEANPVKNPSSCFHLANLPDRERALRMHAMSLGVGCGRTSVSVPAGNAFDFSNDSDNDDDMEGSTTMTTTDPAFAGQNVVVNAGAVLYIPTGTWYKVEGLQGQEGDPMWLQFQLHHVAVGDLLTETVRQLVASQPAMRERLQDPRNGDASTPQQHVAVRMRELSAQLTELTPNEMLPALLFTTDENHIVGDRGGDRGGAVRVVAYDLTDPSSFQGGDHVRIYKGSMFQVNPLAVLMTADELPALATSGPALSASSVSTPAAPKKALNRKNKRLIGHAASSLTVAQAPPTPLTANGSAGPNQSPKVYLLYFGCGGVENQPRLKVQFRCNPVQQALVDWIRARETSDAFHVSELALVLKHYQGDGPEDTEMLKLVLRFLCTTGYLTAVNVPL